MNLEFSLVQLQR